MRTWLRVALWLALAPGAAFAGDPAKKVDGKSAEWLVGKLPDAKDAATRAAILAEMGELRDPALLAHLVHAAGDPDREVKVAAIGGLVAYGPQLADAQRDDAYLVALQDASPEVVRAAHDALAARLQAAAEPGVDALVEALTRLGKSGRSWQTRKAAIELLERLPAPEPGIDQALVDIARTELHAEVRRAAVVALGTRSVALASTLLSRIRSKDPEEQVRMAAEDSLRRIGGPATSIVVAVLPFETQAKGLHAFASDLQDYFTTSLAAAEVAQVVERRQVSAILTELKFQDANIDDGKAVKVGQLLRATQVVVGTIQGVGDEVTCLAKRVDVATGQVWASQPAVGATHDLQALTRECAKRLMESF